MRARDVRAITFCAVTTVVVLVASWLLLGNYLASLALTGGYAALLLTRPRMQRVFARLRGDPDWSAYFDNREKPMTPSTRAPGTTAPSPRPAERR